LNFDKPKNVPQGGGHNADDFQTVYDVVEIMRWMTHKFGYYNVAMKKASRIGVKLAMQLFKMKLGPYVVQFGSHVTHAELMALDMFTKPVQAQVKGSNLGVEKNLDIIEEVLERDTNIRSYAAYTFSRHCCRSHQCRQETSPSSSCLQPQSLAVLY
jgi:hypothetical protein